MSAGQLAATARRPRRQKTPFSPFGAIEHHWQQLRRACSGKSSLADSLVRGIPATRPTDDRTVGIEVRRWPLGAGQGERTRAVRRAPENLVAHIYDAAGHRVYRASHGAFMSAEALFLLVVRSDDPEDKTTAAILEWVARQCSRRRQAPSWA